MNYKNIVKIPLLILLFVSLLLVSNVMGQNSNVQEHRLPIKEYRDKMKAGWIGQMVGVGWGAPTEFRYQSQIIPEDKVPVWLPVLVNQFAQDDIYVEMTFLRTLEEYGFDVSITQAGIDFANSGYMLWHANKAGRDNLRKGIAPPNSSHPQFSQHSDDIDYQIEADYSGLIAPGLPNTVITLGEKFGRLVNYGDGLYAGQFVGAMYAEAFFETDILKIIYAGLTCIPTQSQYAEMVRDVLQWRQENPDDWEKTWQLINEKYQENPEYRRFSCTGSDGKLNIDAKINGAYILMGLLYGNGDPDQTAIISMRCGQDSDCNPSNALGILMTTMGYSNLPPRFVSELDQNTKFSFTDYDFPTLVNVCEKLATDAVINAGGRVEENASGDKILVIPVQTPVPSALEQSWNPGPISDIQFTKKELAQARGLWYLKYTLWILPFLALVLFKENHKWPALMIFIPLGIVIGLWILLDNSIAKDLSSTTGTGPLVMSLAVGLALLALLGDKIARVKWPMTYLYAIILLLVVGYLGSLGMNAGRLEAVTKISLMTFYFSAGALLLTLTLAAACCRSKYGPKKFTAFFLLWAIVFQIVGMFLYLGLNWGFVSGMIGKLSSIIIVTLILGAVMGIILFLVTLPFLILFYNSPFYRVRFTRCLRFNGE